MKLRCPACGSEASLEAFLAGDVARAALVKALRFPAPLANLMVQYLAMFRPAKHALTFDRVDALLGDLFEMVDKAQVSLNGNVRPAPLALWKEGLEHMVELRSLAMETPPRCMLKLPLKTNGYLVTVVHGYAEKAAATAEQKNEERARQGRREEDAPVIQAAVSVGNTRERIRSSYQLAIADHAECMADLVATGMPENAAIEFLAEAEDIRNQLLEKRNG